MTNLLSCAADTKQLVLTADHISSNASASGAIMGPNDTITANETATDNTTMGASSCDDSTTYNRTLSSENQTSSDLPDTANVSVSRGDAKFYFGDLNNMSQQGLVALLHSLGQDVSVTNAPSRMEVFGSVVSLLIASDRIAH